jgi:hypothetical protein
MAGRILNRRELREQVDQAEQSESVSQDDGVGAVAPKKKARAKVPTVPRARKPRAKKLPPRQCARWGVFDGAMKQVAIFDYSQRAAAEEKLANLLATKKGLHFLQIVKEPMPEPALAPATE